MSNQSVFHSIDDHTLAEGWPEENGNYKFIQLESMEKDYLIFGQTNYAFLTPPEWHARILERALNCFGIQFFEENEHLESIFNGLKLTLSESKARIRALEMYVDTRDRKQMKEEFYLPGKGDFHAVVGAGRFMLTEISGILDGTSSGFKCGIHETHLNRILTGSKPTYPLRTLIEQYSE